MGAYFGMYLQSMGGGRSRSAAQLGAMLRDSRIRGRARDRHRLAAAGRTAGGSGVLRVCPPRGWQVLWVPSVNTLDTY
jgi:hypothetical protein